MNLERPWKHQNASSERLGGILDHLADVVAPSWPALAPSWAVLGPSWPRYSLSGLLENLEILVVFQYFSKFHHFCIFSPLGCIVTRLKGVLGPFLAVLGTSWRRLGPSWRRLGASWGAFWPPKTLPRSLQEASKTPPKTKSNIDLNLRPRINHFYYKSSNENASNIKQETILGRLGAILASI